MSRENVEVVRRVYEAAGAGDSDAVFAMYDAGVELDFSRSPFASVVNETVYRGHEGLRRFFRERSEVMKDVTDHCRELIEVGDKVLTVVASRGRGGHSGVAVERTHCGLWSIRAGKVTSVRWFGTQDEALEAVDLSE
jgi:ketosteroid isomerase-like protein